MDQIHAGWDDFKSIINVHIFCLFQDSNCWTGRLETEYGHPRLAQLLAQKARGQLAGLCRHHQVQDH